MSVRLIAWAFDQRPCNPQTQARDPLAHFVLVRLAEAADEAGECFPAYATIAAECSQSERSVMRKIEVLVDLKLIAKSARSRTGRQTSNLYKMLAPPEMLRSVANRGDTQSPQAGRGVTDSHPGGDTQSPPGVTLESPHEPSEEPSLNRESAREASPIFRAVFEAWTAKTVGATSWAPSLAAWTVATDAVAEEALAGAARKAIAGGAKKALQYWLRDEDWRAFAAQAATSCAAHAWNGPAAILHELARHHGQDRAVGWLRCAAWDGERRRIAHRTGTGRDWLRRALAPAAWAALGVDLIEKGDVAG